MQADQMNQTKELVKLSDGSDAGIRYIEPKLYVLQQQDCESPIYRTVKYISPSLGKVSVLSEALSN